MPAGARTHRPMNTPKPMSFTITTDRATTPRAHTLLDIFRHQRNRPNRLPRSPSCASASRNRPVGGGLPMVEQSGHHVDVTAPGVIRQRPGARGRVLSRSGCSQTGRPLWRPCDRPDPAAGHRGARSDSPKRRRPGGRLRRPRRGPRRNKRRLPSRTTGRVMGGRSPLHSFRFGSHPTGSSSDDLVPGPATMQKSARWSCCFCFSDRSDSLVSSRVKPSFAPQ
jgi:hypothetical protein